jgi:hypothetical protein
MRAWLLALIFAAALAVAPGAAAATFSVSPTSGDAGVTVSDSGSGFPNRTNYTVKFGTTTVQTGRTRRRGFSGSFTVPKGYSGATTVTASAGDTSVSSTFDATTPSVSCANGQYKADYFPNPTLTGSPALTQCENGITNDWGDGGPPGLPVDRFSARYDGNINFEAADYGFAVTADDGVRVWVDGNLIIDQWKDQSATTYHASRTMTAGVHDVSVEYYENGGKAAVKLVIAKQTPRPPDTTPPSAPSNLKAIAGDGKVDLNWTASTDNVGVDHYAVYRDGNRIASPTSSSYSDTGLTNGTTYSYVVDAVDAAGNVSGDATASATPKAATSNWPASYFSGPLGSNEVLPAVQGHTMLSMWSGVAGQSESFQRSLMQQRIADMGRAPDLIGFACSGSMTPGSCGQDLSSTDLAENWVHSLGAIPFVANYDPGSSRDFAGIAAGNYDSRIDNAAARLKAFGHRIMVRMFVEFNIQGTWSTTDFINAWRHVVNRFKADGATNVGFWWSPGEQAGGVRTQTDQSYPGDAYVDWVGTDDYDHASSSAYNACVPGWNEFSYIFGYTSADCGAGSMEREWGPEKPFVVGETGSKYDGSIPDRKKQWFLNIATAIPTKLPYTVGVDFFDSDVHIFEAGNNWRVDSKCQSNGTDCTNGATDANTYSGFIGMANSAQFSGGAAGGTS